MRFLRGLLISFGCALVIVGATTAIIAAGCGAYLAGREIGEAFGMPNGHLAGVGGFAFACLWAIILGLYLSPDDDDDMGPM